MKMYLASPLFNETERKTVQAIANHFREQGHEIYVPMEHQIENAWNLPNWLWASKVFHEDVKAIDEAEAVVMVNYGLYSDSGTAWEAGYAYAKGKQIIVIKAKEGKHSLMVIGGSSICLDETFTPISVDAFDQT